MNLTMENTDISSNPLYLFINKFVSELINLAPFKQYTF